MFIFYIICSFVLITNQFCLNFKLIKIQEDRLEQIQVSFLTTAIIFNILKISLVLITLINFGLKCIVTAIEK